MRKFLVVFLSALALAQTATVPVPDAVKQKLLAAYRLQQLRQIDLNTKRDALCAKDKDCLATATKLNEATEALQKEAKAAGDEVKLPKDGYFNVDSDKGDVTVVVPEGKK